MLEKEMRKKFDRDFAKYGINCTQKACLDLLMSYKEEGIDFDYKLLDKMLGYDELFLHEFLEGLKANKLLSWEIKLAPGENNFRMVWDFSPLYELLKTEPVEKPKVSLTYYDYDI